MKKKLKKIWAGILLIFSHSGPIANRAVDDGICNFSGQGRDAHGR